MAMRAINPIRSADESFTRRFENLEDIARDESRPLSDMSHDELAERWQRVKAAAPSTAKEGH